MILDIVPEQLQILMLLSVRVLVIISLTPVLSQSGAPFFARVALAGLTTFAIQNLLQGSVEAPKTVGQFILFLTGEALIGAVIGFFIQMTFALLSMFSEFFSTQMGLRAAQVLDPLSGDTTAIVGQFASIIVTLVFISSFSLQRVFYYGIAQSFVALQSQDLFLYKGGTGSFVSFLFLGLTKLFERSFIIALPLFTSLLLVNIGLGLYGKVAPQMNLLILGIPLQVGLGFLIFFFLIPNLIHALEASFNIAFEYITTFIRGVRL